MSMLFLLRSVASNTYDFLYREFLTNQIMSHSKMKCFLLFYCYPFLPCCCFVAELCVFNFFKSIINLLQKHSGKECRCSENLHSDGLGC